MRRKRKGIMVGLLGVAALCLGGVVAGCVDEPADPVDGDDNKDVIENVERYVLPQSAERSVDLLFVIDNSHSMASHQQNLKENFPALMNALKNMPGGMPGIHIGVVTSDLGAGQYTSIRYCETRGGDRGVLGMSESMEYAQNTPVENRLADRGELCIGPGQRYIVDVEPDGCEIMRDGWSNSCLSHECFEQHCESVAQGGENLSLYVDENGCPRCRNYSGYLSDVFSCYADVGIYGCGFEQHLEAMRKALDVEETPENEGFLRETAYLAVVVVADEDDCSAAKPDVLYDPDPHKDNLNSELGFLHSFRCFEFGIGCNVNSREPGVRTDCSHERDDDLMMLHPVDRYTTFMKSVKDPMMTIVAAISGPVGDEIFVQMDSSHRPELQASCVPTGSPYGADPAVRIKGFAGYFNTPDDLDFWALNSVCSPDYSPALAGIAYRTIDTMSEKCPTQPISGCSEWLNGTSPCLPDCSFADVENRGLVQENKLDVVWCGSVCQNGLCTQDDMEECDFDEQGYCRCSEGLGPTVFGDDRQIYCAPLLYPDGPIDEKPFGLVRDSRLQDIIPRLEPTCEGGVCTAGRSSACWYVSDDTDCESGLVIRIIRGEEPPPRTFSEGLCQTADVMD